MILARRYLDYHRIYIILVVEIFHHFSAAFKLFMSIQNNIKTETIFWLRKIIFFLLFFNNASVVKYVPINLNKKHNRKYCFYLSILYRVGLDLPFFDFYQSPWGLSTMSGPAWWQIFRNISTHYRKRDRSVIHINGELFIWRYIDAYRTFYWTFLSGNNNDNHKW